MVSNYVNVLLKCRFLVFVTQSEIDILLTTLERLKKIYIVFKINGVIFFFLSKTAE